jgi:hypothetical protein
MRWLGLLALLVSSQVHADPFTELGGGLASPIGDSDWTNAANLSPKLYARFGGGDPEGIGGFVGVDWTPVEADNSVVTFHRFRIQGGVVLRHHLAPKVVLAGRLSAGVDILHEHAEVTIPIIGTVEGSDTDLGIAFEVAGGLWFAVGHTTQLGFEVGLPIGVHFNKGNPNNPSDPNDARFDYTSMDLDLLFGVRFGI